LSLSNAYMFVNQTKVDEAKSTDEVKNDEIKENNKGI